MENEKIVMEQTEPTFVPDESVEKEFVDPDKIFLLKELWKRRQAIHRSEKSLTLQAVAMCRRLISKPDMTKEETKKEGKKLFKAVEKEYKNNVKGVVENSDVLVKTGVLYTTIFFECRELIKKNRLTLEKDMAKIVETLPVWKHYAKDLYGISFNSVAGLVGECGDLNNYKHHKQLWKRLGVSVVCGERQRKTTNVEKAIKFGYVPARRSYLYNVGVNLIKKDSLYRPLFEKRLLYRLAVWPETEENKKRIKGHRMNDCRRYVEKRWAKDMMRAWKQYHAVEKQSEHYLAEAA